MGIATRFANYVNRNLGIGGAKNTRDKPGMYMTYANAPPPGLAPAEVQRQVVTAPQQSNQAPQQQVAVEQRAPVQQQDTQQQQQQQQQVAAPQFVPVIQEKKRGFFDKGIEKLTGKGSAEEARKCEAYNSQGAEFIQLEEKGVVFCFTPIELSEGNDAFINRFTGLRWSEENQGKIGKFINSLPDEFSGLKARYSQATYAPAAPTVKQQTVGFFKDLKNDVKYQYQQAKESITGNIRRRAESDCKVKKNIGAKYAVVQQDNIFFCFSGKEIASDANIISVNPYTNRPWAESEKQKLQQVRDEYLSSQKPQEQPQEQDANPEQIQIEFPNEVQQQNQVTQVENARISQNLPAVNQNSNGPFTNQYAVPLPPINTAQQNPNGSLFSTLPVLVPNLESRPDPIPDDVPVAKRESKVINSLI